MSSTTLDGERKSSVSVNMIFVFKTNILTNIAQKSSPPQHMSRITARLTRFGLRFGGSSLQSCSRTAQWLHLHSALRGCRFSFGHCSMLQRQLWRGGAERAGARSAPRLLTAHCFFGFILVDSFLDIFLPRNDRQMNESGSWPFVTLFTFFLSRSTVQSGSCDADDDDDDTR